jgi:hypothetical protein
MAQTPDLIDADRPGLADTGTVIGKGRLQVEIGVQWEPDDDGHSYFMPTLFRVGLSRRIEARIEGNSYSWAEESGVRTSGLAPFSLGVKGVLLEAEGKRPDLGVIGRVFPAWGSGAFDSNRVTGDIRFASDWAFAGPWSLNPNVGIGWYEGEDRDFTTGLFALTLTYAPKPNVAWFVDVGGQTTEAENEDGVESMIIDAGVAYIARENWQFDISAGKRALGRTSSQGFISMGISYRHK